MLRQINLAKFPTKSTTFRPQILTNITILQRRPYDSSTPKLIAIDTNSNVTYQLYIIRKLNQLTKQNIEFITHIPNILLLEKQPFSLVFQQQTSETLKEYLSGQQTRNHQPYLSQHQVKQLLVSVIRSLESFEKNGVQYHCVSDCNVVRLRNGDWVMSLAGMVGDCFAGERNFFDMRKKGWEAVCYAVGSLAFKLLFGFVPYEDMAKKPSTLKLSAYIDFLQQSSSDKKLLKLYHFTSKIHLLSQRCRTFLQQCLSGKITTFCQLQNHAYFSFISQLPKKQYIQNKQIQVLNYFDKKYHSLIMAAIQRRKKYPHEKLHPTMGRDISGFLEVKEMAGKDSLLKFLNFVQIQMENEQQHSAEESYDNLKLPEKYFNSAEFDLEQNQRPTLQLIKFIQKDRVKNPQLYTSTTGDRQSKIKLYAFPYTMVFQLANVYHEQPVEIKKKIEQLIPLLLEVSAMHWPVQRLPCLHVTTKLKYTKFEQIKLRYRQLINTIYKYFLTQAMKRYNARKENLTIGEKMRLKEEGLGYYRLCLKLMEVSLVVRKGGRDLDLQRIQTSQRKEVQQDLEAILKTFFPNRVEIK